MSLNPAILRQLADALAKEITTLFGASSGLNFTAERTYFLEYPLDMLDVTRVNVSMQEEHNDVHSRGDEENHYVLNVGFQKHVQDVTDNSEMDALLDLSDAVSRHYLIDKTTLKYYPTALCVGKQKNPVCNPKYISTNNVFFCLLTLTFRVWVADNA